MKTSSTYKSIIFVIVLIFVLLFARNIYAVADVTDIRNKINDANTQIRQIENEIKTYEGELNKIGSKKKTLKNDIYKLNISAKKIAADINLTKNKIYSTNLTVSELNTKIKEKEDRIEKNRRALTESIKKINEQDQVSLIEAIFTYRKLSDFWANTDTLQSFQDRIGKNLGELRALKAGLNKNKEDELNKKKELSTLKSSLEDKKGIVVYNKREKDKILDVTENKEDEYQSYLQKAEARKDAFLRSLAQLESELKIAIDPSSIPSSGSGVLAPPLNSIFVTQRFGDTEFSKSGAYNGKGHNGIDLRASIGTTVKSASSGVVEGTGNTDAIPGCYSYGKWVLVKHNTGLSTLYAHLSVISVSPGESVITGDTVGYSGNSGYSTGPHLHFTTYATQGVRIVRLGDIKAKTNCADARIPVAPFEAYLNPLDYL